MLAFLVIGLGIYYGGTALLGLERLNWAAPVWTAKHVGLVAVGMVVGGLAGLLAFAFAMTIEVPNMRINDLLIILWQFLANGSLIWFMTMGIAMSVALGNDAAKTAVIQFGAERAVAHVVATGSVVGLLMGAVFFLAPIIRLPLIAYLVISASVALLAARWHFSIYGIESRLWVVPGLVVPIVLLLFAPAMIERDRRQRRLVAEQSLMWERKRNV